MLVQTSATFRSTPGGAEVNASLLAISQRVQPKLNNRIVKGTATCKIRVICFIVLTKNNLCNPRNPWFEALWVSYFT